MHIRDCEIVVRIDGGYQEVTSPDVPGLFIVFHEWEVLRTEEIAAAIDAIRKADREYAECASQS